MCCHRREREGGREAFRGRLRRSSARTCVREKPEECVQEKTQPQSVSSGVCFGGADLYVWMDSQWQSGKSKGIFSRPFWEYCLEYSGYVTCSGGGDKILLQLKTHHKTRKQKVIRSNFYWRGSQATMPTGKQELFLFSNVFSDVSQHAQIKVFPEVTLWCGGTRFCCQK